MNPKEASLPLEIVVCVKPVPDPRKAAGTAPGTAGATGRTTVDREGVPLVPNRNDRVAVEVAVRLKEALAQGTPGPAVPAVSAAGSPASQCSPAPRVTAVLMGPPAAETAARECLAAGADEAWLVSDRALAGSDALATARSLAAAVRHREGASLILTGVESSDGGTGQVGPTLAALLGFDLLSGAAGVKALAVGDDGGDRGSEVLEIDVSDERGWSDVYQAGLPLVVTVVRSAVVPRPVTMIGIVKARSKPLLTLDCAALGLDSDLVGAKGSPTRVTRLLPLKSEARAKMITGDAAEQAQALAGLMREKGFAGGGGRR